MDLGKPRQGLIRYRYYINHKDVLNIDILSTGLYAQLVVWLIVCNPTFGNLRVYEWYTYVNI